MPAAFTQPGASTLAGLRTLSGYYAGTTKLFPLVVIYMVGAAFPVVSIYFEFGLVVWKNSTPKL